MEKKTILLIEGNVLNLKLVLSLLQLENYNVLAAIDAETVIQLTRD